MSGTTKPLVGASKHATPQVAKKHVVKSNIAPTAVAAGKTTGSTSRALPIDSAKLPLVSKPTTTVKPLVSGVPPPKQTAATSTTKTSSAATTTGTKPRMSAASVIAATPAAPVPVGSAKLPLVSKPTTTVKPLASGVPPTKQTAATATTKTPSAATTTTGTKPRMSAASAIVAAAAAAAPVPAKNSTVVDSTVAPPKASSVPKPMGLKTSSISSKVGNDAPAVVGTTTTTGTGVTTIEKPAIGTTSTAKPPNVAVVSRPSTRPAAQLVSPASLGGNRAGAAAAAAAASAAAPPASATVSGTTTTHNKKKSYFDDDDDMDVPVNTMTKALRELPYRDLIPYHTTMMQFDTDDDFSPNARKIIAQLMRFRVTPYSIMVMMQLVSMEIHRDRNAKLAKRSKADAGGVNAHHPVPTGDASLAMASAAANATTTTTRNKNTFNESITQATVDKFEDEWLLDFVSLTDASHMLAWGRSNFDKALRTSMDAVYKFIEKTFDVKNKLIRSVYVVNKKRPWMMTHMAGKIARSDLAVNLELNDVNSGGPYVNPYLPFWIDFMEEEVDSLPDGKTAMNVAGMTFPLQFQNTDRLNDEDIARCANSIGISLQYMLVVTEAPCLILFMVRRLVCRSTGEQRMFINFAVVFRETKLFKYIERIAMERFFDPYFPALWENATRPSYEDEELIDIDPIAANAMIDPDAFRRQTLKLDAIMQHIKRGNVGGGHVARYTDEQLQAFMDPTADVSDCVSWTNIRHNSRDIVRTLRTAGLSMSTIRDTDVSAIPTRKRKLVDESKTSVSSAIGSDKGDHEERNDVKRARMDSGPAPMEIDNDDEPASASSAPARPTPSRAQTTHAVAMHQVASNTQRPIANKGAPVRPATKGAPAVRPPVTKAARLPSVRPPMPPSKPTSGVPKT